jgi:protease I
MSDAPWALVEADVVEDRTLTSSASLRTELERAGAQWVDEPVYTCTRGPNALVTSRGQDDLEAFCDALVQVVARSDH